MKKILFLFVLSLLVLTGCSHVANDTKKTTNIAPGGEVATFDLPQGQQQTITTQNSLVESETEPTEESNEETMNEESNTINLDEVTQATFKTNKGDMTVEFYRDDSPKTVENFLKLASEGFYDDVKFHRVIKGFMIQTGDPLSKDDSQQGFWGTGGPGYKFADEFNDHKLVQGSLAMANSGPNTNGSQFFIVTTASTPWLDGKHTNFGYVTEGIEVALAIEGVATEGPDRPVDPVIIESIELK